MINVGKTIAELRLGALGDNVEFIVKHFKDNGYSVHIICQNLYLMRKIDMWLKKNKVPLTKFNQKNIDRFLEDHKRRIPSYKDRRDLFTYGKIFKLLRERGSIPPAIKPKKSEIEVFMDKFGEYILVEKEKSPYTLRWTLLRCIKLFLTEIQCSNPQNLSKLTSHEVVFFVEKFAKRSTVNQSKNMIYSLRTLFRYLKEKGIHSKDLSVCVLPVSSARKKKLPKHISQKERQQLLQSCDFATPAGYRDYVMFLMMMRLGLRAPEVMRLTLDDFCWRQSKVKIRSKINKIQILPITEELGKAITVYIKEYRPKKAKSRHLFVSTAAPFKKFSTTGAIHNAIYRAAKRAGLNLPSCGAHIFRHSIAKDLLKDTSSFYEIKEMLRHESFNTSKYYISIDLDGLQILARPWPLEEVSNDCA